MKGRGQRWLRRPAVVTGAWVCLISLALAASHPYQGQELCPPTRGDITLLLWAADWPLGMFTVPEPPSRLEISFL